ncbi:hypothetical protein J2TS6_13290 [Paenibacillus albilobatus]|uniref:Uncharacterized protein n=1 Tax=Paenibacillus albilobatus TaxID=2716884 RepID=A0A919XF03_9BACL|nr:hypothetical protein J2TS6_13290 [Paenibacillus albilobatus]
MIFIGIAFMCIIGYEWRYMTKKNRKKRTFFLVIGSAVFMCICVEALYFFKEQWTIAMLIEGIFGPAVKILNAGE